MEQKRTLWIIAAVGVFLLVVIGAALILYSPSLHTTAAPSTAQLQGSSWRTPQPPEQATVQPPVAAAQPATPEVPVEPVSTTADPETPSDTTPQNKDSVTVISGNTTVYGTGTTTIDLNTLKASNSTTPVSPQNELTAAAMSSTQSQQMAQQKTAPAPAQPAAPAPVPSKTISAPVTASKSTAAKPTPKKAAAPAPAVKPADKWWIQAASFTAKKNADDARSVLETNKIPSEVFTYKDSKGKLFYRVRIGPYTTKSEAEYWQTRISYISEFSKTASYIVNSSAKAVK